MDISKNKFKFKRIFTLLLCVTLLASMSILPVNATETYDEARPAYSKGDLNGDGEITAADYLIIKRIFLETYTPTAKQAFAADVNSDGYITAVDYLMHKRYFYQTYYFAPDVMMVQVPLTNEQLDTIKADYVEYLKTEVGAEHFSSLTPVDINITISFGPYSGSYALFISHREACFTQAMTIEYIAGYEFIYSDGQTYTIYKDSSFYDVKTAYESGLITKADVYDLSWHA